MTVAKLLPTAQTYKQMFKNTMAFHTELETVSRKFPEIFKFSEQTYFSLKSSISHLSPAPKASCNSMLEQYFHRCFSSSGHRT